MHRRTILLSGGAAVTAAAVLAQGPASAQADWSGMRVLLARLHAARRAAAVPELVHNPALMEMARGQSMWMQRLGDTSHTGPGGADPVARALDVGYSGRVLGEALADTFDDAGATIALWLSHAPTRAVVLDPDARSVGAFGWREASGRVWWDLVVGQAAL